MSNLRTFSESILSNYVKLYTKYEYCVRLQQGQDKN